MGLHNKNLGKLGEDLAAEFLTKKGYKIIDRNFLIRGGEIDLVATCDDVLVFIEVKTRVGREFGLPEESITPWKIHSLIKTAAFYQVSHPALPESLRIDLVAVELTESGKLKRIELIEDITS